MSSSSLDAMPHLKNALRSEEDVSLIGMESVGCESYVLSVDDQASAHNATSRPCREQSAPPASGG
jgi:hypothetical protein